MNTGIRLLVAIATLFLTPALIVIAAPDSQDPGPLGDAAGAGDPLPNLTPGQWSAFTDGADDFNTSHSVDGSIPDADATGLGPTFNLENCGGCHAQPAVGGSSPARNPQFESAIVAGGRNVIPSFLQLNGPARSAIRRQCRWPARTARFTISSRLRIGATRQAAGSRNPTSRPRIGAAI